MSEAALILERMEQGDPKAADQLPTKERLDLFIKVCQAIQHAHQKGVIHRDIKPSNILVTVNDGVPVPKVLDFGIAQATQGELTDKTVFTQFQQFMGTPAYISPEQAQLSSVTDRNLLSWRRHVLSAARVIFVLYSCYGNQL